MGSESMDLEAAAALVGRDSREVAKLASRGYLPGRRVGDAWRFSRTEVTQWVEQQMHAYTEQELSSLEGNGAADMLLGNHLSPDCVAVPLRGRTKQSVLRELVNVAERSWQVYDAGALLAALEQREALGPTALANGVALPHPHRPLPQAVGDHVLVYGRTLSGIPFGGPGGALSDLFFLVACTDERSHLKVLARLSRLLLWPGFTDQLRTLDDPAESYALITMIERELVTA
jgi:PTS system nitrogen regulatory IIA component